MSPAGGGGHAPRVAGGGLTQARHRVCATQEKNAGKMPALRAAEITMYQDNPDAVALRL